MSRFHYEQVLYAQATIDSIYAEIQRVGFAVAAMPELRTVSSVARRTDYTAGEAIAARRLYLSLFDRLNQTPILHSIYVYFPQSGSIVSQSGLVRFQDYHDTGWVEEYRQKENRIALLPTRHVRENEDSLPAEVLTLVMPNQIYGSDATGLIALNIRMSAVAATIGSLVAAAGDFLILDADGAVIRRWGFPEPLADLESVLPMLRGGARNGQTSPVSSLQGENLLAWARSAQTPLEYLTIVPLRSLFRSIASIRSVMLLVSAAVFVAGLLASYMLTARIYSPVSGLMAKLKDEIGLATHDERGELAIITDTLNRMIDEEKNSSVDRIEHERRVNESRLLALIQSDDPPEEEQQIMRDRSGLCIVGCVDRYARFVRDYSEIEQYYLRRLIVNVAVRIVEQRFECHGLLLPDNKIVLIVTARESGNGAAIEFDASLMEAVQSEVARAGNLSVSFGLGSPFRDAHGVKTSHIHAEESLRYKFLRGHGSVIPYESIPGVGVPTSYHSPTDMEIRTMNRLSAGTENCPTECAAELVGVLKDGKGLTYNNARLIVSQVLGTMIRYLDQAQLNANDAFADRNVFAELALLETVEDTGEWVESMLRRVLGYKRDHSIEGHFAVVRLVDFIRSNLTNPQLDISMTADAVGLSYNQVRTLIRDTFGTNYIDYVNRMRIEIAARQLVDTDRSVEEIARSCGYANVQSLNRFFKKYEGVTPGAYQKAHGVRLGQSFV